MYLPCSLTLTATDEIKHMIRGTRSRHKQRRKHWYSIRSRNRRDREIFKYTDLQHLLSLLIRQVFRIQNTGLTIAITYAWAYEVKMDYGENIMYIVCFQWDETGTSDWRLIFHVTVSLSLRPDLHSVAHVEPHDNGVQHDSLAWRRVYMTKSWRSLICLAAKRH